MSRAQQFFSFLFFLVAFSTVSDSFPLDIVDKNMNLILGLIWTMILRYQVSDSDGTDDGGARKALLEWLRSIGIMVNNLTDEYVFLMLVGLFLLELRRNLSFCRV